LNFSLNQDDFDYAFETSRIIREPARFIDSFGITRFDFIMACEQMDSAGKVCIRTGVVEAQKPTIVRPDMMNEVSYDGFSEGSQEEAKKFLSWLASQGVDLAFLKYGFEFKKLEVKEEIVHNTLENVIDKLESEADRKNNPSLAVLEGVDDSWEVSLFKFTIQMINKSTGVNITDFQRKGLL